MKYILFVFGFFLMGFTNTSNVDNTLEKITCTSSNDDICTQLVENCRATADQEYQNGNMSESLYLEFYYELCPDAGLDCVFDVYGG